jgi:hypothetical protein
MSYLKPPPKELLFRIYRNCSTKDTTTAALVNPNSSSTKKTSLGDMRNEDNSRSYLSESDSSSSNQEGEDSEHDGSDYEAKKRKTKKTSTVKK